MVDGEDGGVRAWVLILLLLSMKYFRIVTAVLTIPNAVCPHRDTET
jgi:hypothetical protein